MYLGGYVIYKGSSLEIKTMFDVLISIYLFCKIFQTNKWFVF